ncbi:MAG: hypothetical protein JWQ09_1033 [Segetibacter sp.]|nr:hypothetical protein [Segetibacter sp.]
MAKSRRKKREYDAAKALVIKKLSAKYNVTDSFVRLAVNGDRDSETAEKIKKEYNVQNEAHNKITESI